MEILLQEFSTIMAFPLSTIEWYKEKVEVFSISSTGGVKKGTPEPTGFDQILQFIYKQI